jgi:nitroreductase
MKIKSALFIFLLITTCQLLTGQITSTPVIDLLQSAYSERSYSPEPVTDQQLNLILKCGINAPSARNNQPWRFTVIRDKDTMKEIINNAETGNVLIIVSGLESQQPGINADFDCGLAAESMFVAAHGLGLGARIYGSPAGNINSKREMYQVPAGYKAVVVLRIGNIDKTVDAVTAATKRKDFNEIVNFKK